MGADMEIDTEGCYHIMLPFNFLDCHEDTD